MTQDEIIEMARQAGFYISPFDSVLLPKLETFTKLVEKKVHNDASTYMLKIHNDWFCVKKQEDKHD
jgi:hypothetical protein